MGIEERAIQARAAKAYPILSDVAPENDLKNEQFLAYIKGATEQKKIDSDEFKKLVVWKLGSAHDAYVRSNPQDESYTKGKFDALDELYKELIRKE